MHYLYLVTALLLLASFIRSRSKTVKAFKIAVKKMTKILPAFLIMIIMMSIVLYLIPSSVYAKYLEKDVQFLNVFIAAVIGSITLLPGFIVFPMCDILQKQGVSYTVLAVFTTTLMMVGILTFPIEKEYFGIRLAIIRNIIGFLIAMLIAFVIGLAYGEIL